ncbi:MAG: TraR/DksA C4-type zinc finger protein [Chloroflexi bacterium]|nr:TraR/DksA C4-type zinc finger protein [Chloroflexota bacterium]
MIAQAASTTTALSTRSFDDLLAEAAAFHGHACPGQVLGVRIALAGCREVELDTPRAAGKGLVVFVEIDRCATDAIQALTGVSLGKRTLKHLDYGKMAATFVNVATGRAVRVAARDSARARVQDYASPGADARQAQFEAYRVMPEAELLSITPVAIQSGWLDRKRVRVFCDRCGEGINYQREVSRDGQTICRPCAGERYCLPSE